ncbi:hypothetical protein POF50_021980 [Streptomyces sp. SL13]|jgi:hypothetical protein|uniref:Uncharacterized protein n=1 Tax=Streptantibioticus silvisoli TaxID=2705255 RepID=A0AA90H7H2_9ACTN|nr:hypothetical protein [Streptantibioticus silvisoli]MDI5966066.1 hypothetical protein [Streptantibioticus silvisoli]MDI5971972.1 hypothetical protein [Streptantibioticus silvisoli]
MGANEDFKRLAKEMAEKARAQREKGAQSQESTDEEARRESGEKKATADPRRRSDKK